MYALLTKLKNLIRMGNKGQSSPMGLVGAVIALIVIGIAASVGVMIIDKFTAQTTTNGSFNASTSASGAILQITGMLGIVAFIIIGAFLIGYLIRSFTGGGGRGGR